MKWQILTQSDSSRVLFLFDREMLRIWQKSSNNACLFFDVSICWFLLPRHSSTSDALSFCKSKTILNWSNIFWPGPKSWKVFNACLFFDVLICWFLLPHHSSTYISDALSLPVEPKLFWVGPNFFWLNPKVGKKSSMCVYFSTCLFVGLCCLVIHVHWCPVLLQVQNYFGLVQKILGWTQKLDRSP